MATSNNHPFYGSSHAGMTASGDQRRLALDNLIRRELKVGDPNDPKQIAEALLNRFKDDPRANAITQEAKGLPFLQTGSAIVTQPASTSSSNELKQAMDDINADLAELTTNTLLKDVTPELQGWADAIRGTIAEGINAARFALDPRQRDKVFGIRRNLQDYARAARLVGAVTPALNQTYRSFAKSLDEAASVLLVMMGEALAEAGFNGGRYLLSVPYTELQVRRDTVISALRGLVGSSYATYEQEDYPYGLHGYQQLLEYLEDHGQGDLRTMLVETELSRSMDMLIQRAAHGTPEGLRALGATAAIELRRYKRMLRAANVVSESSPPLKVYQKALQLFIDAFSAGGGYRLISIARPSVLLYGLYDVATSPDTDVLNDLVRQRGRLASQLDCFLNCECNSSQIVHQVIFDKLLYDTDRAIDLYAMSSDESDEAEARAMSYGYLIKYVSDIVLAAQATTTGDTIGIILGSVTYKLKSADISSINEILKKLIESLFLRLGVYKQLTPKDDKGNNNDQALIDLCDRELCAQYEAEESLKDLVNTLAPKCNLKLTEGNAGFFGTDGLNSVLVKEARKLLCSRTELPLCEGLGVTIPAPANQSRQGQLQAALNQVKTLAATSMASSMKMKEELKIANVTTGDVIDSLDFAKNIAQQGFNSTWQMEQHYVFPTTRPKIQLGKPILLFSEVNAKAADMVKTAAKEYKADKGKQAQYRAAVITYMYAIRNTYRISQDAVTLIGKILDFSVSNLSTDGDVDLVNKLIDGISELNFSK